MMDTNREANDMAEEAKDEEIIPREYQSLLLEKCIKTNTILYLPTGTGKTYIAVMLIKHMAGDLDGAIDEGGKRTFFMVNTVALVEQQANYIRRHTPLSVGHFSGDMNVDYWTKAIWLSQLNKYKVFVMTTQIFLDILLHGFISLKVVNLLIFDECHHAVNDHNMAQVMETFHQCDAELRPRVLGMTATILNGDCKLRNVKCELEKLEETYMCQIATADDMEMVRIHATNPKEICYRFEEEMPSPVAQEVAKHLEKVSDWIMGVKLEFEKQVPRILDGYRLMDEKLKANKKLKNKLYEVTYHLNDLGMYAGSISAIKLIIMLERLRARAEDPSSELVYVSMITTLNMVRKILEDEMSSCDEKERIYRYSSPKVLGLIKLLRGLKPTENGKPPRGIIFVQRRFTAQVLYTILKYLKKHDSDFEFLSPDFMIGFQSNPMANTREGALEKKRNTEAFKKFNLGKTNIMTSSDVLEEGIDIPQCNVVVKFDLPMSYRSYIQSKGRARHKNSKYIIMLPVSNSKFSTKYDIYQEMEALLQNILSQRKKGKSNEILDKPCNGEENNLEYCVKTEDGISRVTMNSSISLLNRYCSLLPQDVFTDLAPLYYLKEVHTEKGPAIQCILQLPINSPIRQIIEGYPMPNKRLARQAVALRVCETLHKAGELNDNLLPVGSQPELFDDATLFPHWRNEKIKEDEPRPGTKKHKRNYLKKIPEWLCQCAPQANKPAYLHVLQMRAAYKKPPEDDSRKFAFFQLLQANEGFAILSSKEIPMICDFPIFLNVGQLDVSLKPNHMQVVLSHDEIARLRRFNTVIFYSLLRLCKSFMTVDLENEENSYFIVPTNLDSSGNICIDWDTVKRHPNIPEVQRLNDEERINIEVTTENYQYRVVAPWYRCLADQMYVVTKICDNMTPFSPFPTKEYMSFEAYYMTKYKQQIKSIMCVNQPLIEVKAISNKINCLRPRGTKSGQSTSKRKRQENQDDFEEHFIPELCFRFKFPSALWLKATCLPSVLHRVTLLLLAEELRLNIARDMGFNPHVGSWAPLKVDQSCLENSESTSPVQSSSMNHKLANIRLAEPAPVARLENSGTVLWNHEEEPIDIDREYLEDFTLVDVIYYDEFISKPLFPKDKKNDSSNPFDELTSSSRTSPIKKLPPVGVKAPIHILEVNSSSVGPQQYEVLQALTAASSADVLNMERLETLGDSFLKFSTSFFLFMDFPYLDEGKLSILKGKIVGNRNLFYCGEARGISNIMKVQEFSARNDWIPPSFCVPRQLQAVIREANLCPSLLYEVQLPSEDQLQGVLSSATRLRLENQLLEWERDNILISSADNFIGMQIVSDKAVADCVEAILGAYLKGYGVEGAAKLLEWFEIIPPGRDFVRKFMDNSASTAFINPEQNTPENIEFFLSNPDIKLLEMLLGYHFKDRSFLLQALTHASYIQNRVTECYQRLEFLGDAILDFLITCHIYETCENLSPGELTDLRSALVNNITFGCLAVRYSFHQFCKYDSVRLFDKIDTFVKYQESQNHEVNEKVLILVEEDSCKLAETVDVPKVLGDIFESLAGAVFLDSGKSLEKVWQVFYRLMKQEIDQFKANIPKQPVRLLYEKFHQDQITFFNPRAIEDTNNVLVKLEVKMGEVKKKYYGVGDNKANAKRAAAKLALKDLR